MADSPKSPPAHTSFRSQAAGRPDRERELNRAIWQVLAATFGTAACLACTLSGLTTDHYVWVPITGLTAGALLVLASSWWNLTSGQLIQRLVLAFGPRFGSFAPMLLGACVWGAAELRSTSRTSREWRQQWADATVSFETAFMFELALVAKVSRGWEEPRYVDVTHGVLVAMAYSIGAKPQTDRPYVAFWFALLTFDVIFLALPQGCSRFSLFAALSPLAVAARLIAGVAYPDKFFSGNVLLASMLSMILFVGLIAANTECRRWIEGRGSPRAEAGRLLLAICLLISLLDLFLVLVHRQALKRDITLFFFATIAISVQLFAFSNIVETRLVDHHHFVGSMVRPLPESNFLQKVRSGPRDFRLPYDGTGLSFNSENA